MKAMYFNFSDTYVSKYLEPQLYGICKDPYIEIQYNFLKMAGIQTNPKCDHLVICG